MGESLILKSSLFKDTVEGAGCQVVRGLTRDSYTTGLVLVLKLAMASATSDLVPSILAQHSKYRSHLHSPRLTGRRLMEL